MNQWVWQWYGNKIEKIRQKVFGKTTQVFVIGLVAINFDVVWSPWKDPFATPIPMSQGGEKPCVAFITRLGLFSSCFEDVWSFDHPDPLKFGACSFVTSTTHVQWRCCRKRVAWHPFCRRLSSSTCEMCCEHHGVRHEVTWRNCKECSCNCLFYMCFTSSWEWMSCSF